MVWKKEIPVVDGPTSNRLLKVRLDRTVHFTFPNNVEFDVIDTQNVGKERYSNGSVAVDQSLITLRLEKHQGVPLLTVLFEGSLKALPWNWVKDFTPHPDFAFDSLPVPILPGVVASTPAVSATGVITAIDGADAVKKGK